MRNIVGAEFVETDELAIRLYSKEASGIESKALAVVFPKISKEVSEILRFAYAENLKIYPQGSATGLAGASTPSPDGIILSFDRMNTVKEISIVDGFVVVEPGVRIIHLNEELSKYGYHFPVDPASAKSATVGGLINTGGGGLKGVVYGTMREWVMELEIVLPDEEGSILKIGCKTPKCRQGYDLVRLIVGSEGTLAVVTEATLRIYPQPENVAVIVGFFDDMENVMKTVVEIKKKRISPAILEFADAETVKIGAERTQLGVRGNMLIVGIEVPLEISEKYLRALEDIFKNNNANKILIAETMAKAEEMKLFEIRRAAYPAAIFEASKEIESELSRPLVVIEDIAVPPSKLPETVRKLRALANEYSFPLVLFGHVGDGNLHPTSWVDTSNEKMKSKFWEFLHKIMQIAIDLGGTISAEHGIGTLKKKGLEMEFEKKGSLKALEIMRSIKKIFDPKNILNPGKIF